VEDKKKVFFDWYSLVTLENTLVKDQAKYKVSLGSCKIRMRLNVSKDSIK